MEHPSCHHHPLGNLTYMYVFNRLEQLRAQSGYNLKVFYINDVSLSKLALTLMVAATGAGTRWYDIKVGVRHLACA